ncbi:hypothetical protein [Flavobacterium litorale]|uniref:Lipoprotein n=1 Tax=Flavobacterium litorale TaxID=2856519 RepID=A0ABX8V5Z9_9FLAO|nr:hypothetical protein [Flavobacterium litorale]QYJ68269.1 hypothetical protein K1I41_12205 [Flavobacterium litorale]
MKNSIKYTFLIALVLLTSCQTAKINDVKYNVSSATTELGSIGRAKSLFKLDNDFSTHSFPILQNKVRLNVQVHPFNQKLYNVYQDKNKATQKKQQLQYIDSIATKPELVTISILDVKGYIGEINSSYNTNVVTYLKDTEDNAVVTGLVVTLPKELIANIKMADAYYLTNNQDKKYVISLYKLGKKTSEIDITTATVLGYTLGKFCWAINDRNKWYIADIVKDNKGCEGNTKAKIKKEEQKRLFKM